jgi:hypothetical protein
MKHKAGKGTQKKSGKAEKPWLKERAILAVKKLLASGGNFTEEVKWDLEVKRKELRKLVRSFFDDGTGDQVVSKKVSYHVKKKSTFPDILCIQTELASPLAVKALGLLRDRQDDICSCGKGIMKLAYDKQRDYYCWRCHGSRLACRTKESMYSGSIFEGMKGISTSDILNIGRLMLDNISSGQTASLLHLSVKTVIYWRKRLKAVVTAYHLKYGDGAMIGGEGFTVEIDETKFGHIKYGRGHQVVGIWVVVAVCRETREIIASSVANRNKVTLTQWIKQFVRKGSNTVSKR